MATIRVHFDGKVFVPDEPVDLPVGTKAETRVPSDPATVPAEGHAGRDHVRKTLARLARIADELPDDPDAPTDLAAQKNFYLYDHPKQP